MAWTKDHGYALEELNNHNYSHLLDYAQYSHLQLGRLRQATDIIDLISRDYAESGRAPVFGRALAITSARYLIETAQWDRTTEPATRATIDRFDDNDLLQLAVGLGAGWTGQLDLARAAAQRLETQADDAGRGAVMHQQVMALIRLTENDAAGALRLLTQAAELEDETTAFTHLVTANPMKPSRELYGEVLLRLDRPQEAPAQFEAALIRYRGRAVSLLGSALASAAAGDQAAAAGYYSTLRDNFGDADAGHPVVDELRRFLSN